MRPAFSNATDERAALLKAGKIGACALDATWKPFLLERWGEGCSPCVIPGAAACSIVLAGKRLALIKAFNAAVSAMKPGGPLAWLAEAYPVPMRRLFLPNKEALQANAAL